MARDSAARDVDRRSAAPQTPPITNRQAYGLTAAARGVATKSGSRGRQTPDGDEPGAGVQWRGRLVGPEAVVAATVAFLPEQRDAPVAPCYELLVGLESSIAGDLVEVRLALGAEREVGRPEVLVIDLGEPEGRQESMGRDPQDGGTVIGVHGSVLGALQDRVAPPLCRAPLPGPTSWACPWRLICQTDQPLTPETSMLPWPSTAISPNP
jgi:hypothetical protein